MATVSAMDRTGIHLAMTDPERLRSAPAIPEVASPSGPSPEKRAMSTDQQPVAFEQHWPSASF